jgi:hypothetical protein
MPQSHTMNSTFSPGIRLRNPKFVAQIVVFAFAGSWRRRHVEGMTDAGTKLGVGYG